MYFSLNRANIRNKIEIEDTLEAMQETVGGYIEEYMPFDDEVAIVCKEEGKMNGAELNRAIYSNIRKSSTLLQANSLSHTHH